MRKLGAIPVVLMVAMFLTSVLALPLSSVHAAAPSYDKDDGWAVGQTLQAGFGLKDLPDEFKEDLQALLGLYGIEPDEFDLQVDAELFMLLVIEEERADEYVVGFKMANRLDVKFDIIGKDEHGHRSSLGLDIGYASILDATIIMDKETMAIKSIELLINTAALLSLDGENVPVPDDDFSPDSDVRHEDFDIVLKALFEADVDIHFDPALNLFNASMIDGMSTDDSWDVNSRATVTGKMDGFLDIKGLPAEYEEELFGEDGPFGELGFTKFPVTFDDFEIGDLEVNDGTIKEHSFDIIGTVTVGDVDSASLFGEDKDFRWLELELSDEMEQDGLDPMNLERYYPMLKSNGDGQESIAYAYSEDLLDIFIVGLGLDGLDEEVKDGMDEMSLFGVTYESGYMPVDEAAEKMGPIYDYRNQLAKQVKGETGTSQDYLIWIAVGVVAVLFIAAAAVILIGIRKGP